MRDLHHVLRHKLDWPQLDTLWLQLCIDAEIYDALIAERRYNYAHT